MTIGDRSLDPRSSATSDDGSWKASRRPHPRQLPRQH
jgi:hypothetical protein